MIESRADGRVPPQLGNRSQEPLALNVSIVITVVTPYAAVQVSDMQVTAFKDGAVVSGQQRKSIIMQGSQVVFVIGWTGLATIANHNTGC